MTALAGLGIGPGDEVIVPGYTFIASLSSIIYSRAVPVLAEIDRTFNLDPEDVKAKITPRTKAIMAVHMMGNPARLNELKAIADAHGLFLIEDCAQAFGATYHGRPVGAIGTIGTFSFNVYKTITSGDGGHDRHRRRRGLTSDASRSTIRAIRPCGTESRSASAPLSASTSASPSCRRPSCSRNCESCRRSSSGCAPTSGAIKEIISELPGLEFRELPDPAGDLATMLTVILPNEELARAVAKDLGTKVTADAGWHVYSNMEQILEQRTITPEKCPFTCSPYTSKGGTMRYWKGMLPRTDALLARSLNISIGVSDPGLSSAFGVTIKDGLDVVEERARRFCQVAGRYLKAPQVSAATGGGR